MDDHSLIQLLQQRLRFSRRIQPAHAAVLIAITNEPDPKVLLTRRSAYLNSHAGEVSFPGGKRDATDTSNIVIALREAQEETGLNPFEVELIGDLPMHRARNGMLVKPVVGLIPAGLELNPQPSEIDRIFYVSLDELMHAPPVPYEVHYAHQSLYFPSMRINNEIIWGLTARMLMALFKYGLNYKKEWPFLLNSPTFQARKY
ncbi:CoA pyrophosphatase [Acinetobacter radioresistens]|uniref:CoA pyrophosphatase n=1 Tax=Acinetobacter radioresistens TaxID=40216 RepID=UPI000C3292AB|nr:CoA pyrophosphatase [Acinetobacter radioresistens]MCM1936407.1 CoA pyrophosphatase [Acinetobacter radioresistens]MCM1954059.1 CoA pyrophosphatase [Acinetobacter radioresistens]MCU4309627.1 CoA pyrophosphatase [Acinetobacter radioresistens]MCU4567751.1 CoA pyrophosphatase [Acinetobacter radioresistens]PKH30546.1 coenzyme A pyrophosphatase [Acinetobacter radioresistens]